MAERVPSMLITNPFSAEALRDRLLGELVPSTDEG